MLAVLLLSASQGAQAQSADADTTVVIPDTGVLPVKPSRNFTGKGEGLIVCSLYGSSNATSTGISFNKFGLDSVVIASSPNTSSCLILVGKPGTYTLQLTDAEATGKIFSTTLYWHEDLSQAYARDRRVFKFVNETDHVGFELDQKYADQKYQYCDLGEGEHVYVPLSDKPAEIVATKLGTTLDALTFIPFFGPWRNGVTQEEIEAAGISQAVAASTTTDDACYDLQGRRVGQPAKPGLYIRHHRKTLIK